MMYKTSKRKSEENNKILDKDDKEILTHKTVVKYIQKHYYLSAEELFRVLL